jgi:hypothetical protein
MRTIAAVCASLRALATRAWIPGGVLVAVLCWRPLLAALDTPITRTGATVFVAICVQALPFLVFGVLLSGAIAVGVPAAMLPRLLPARPAVAVPLAGLAGLALPGCECASVPVAGRLIAHGTPDGAALAFLLAAPAINPTVLVATSVAFPGEPGMVLARFAGSLATSVCMGLLWARFGRPEWIASRARRPLPGSAGRARFWVFVEAAGHDLASAGGFLVLGGSAATVLTVGLPLGWLDRLAGRPALSVLVLAMLAVLLALCSEADAFVAASLTNLPLLARLVFLVVGPAVDVKLAAQQCGTFGPSFTARFAPATLLVAVLAGTASGLIFLGPPR